MEKKESKRRKSKLNFTDKEKIRIVVEAEFEPLSKKSVAEKYGVGLHNLYQWKKKYKEQVEAEIKKIEKKMGYR